MSAAEGVPPVLGRMDCDLGTSLHVVPETWHIKQAEVRATWSSGRRKPMASKKPVKKSAKRRVGDVARERKPAGYVLPDDELPGMYDAEDMEAFR